jgi:hypothetical protein
MVRGSNPGGDEVFVHGWMPWHPPSVLYIGYIVIPGVKWQGHGVDHPPQSSAKVIERAKLYLYPYMSSWQ